MKRAARRCKKILVTAGPTWVALDPVRVISNVSTGRMGFALAREAKAAGADVDLFLGPVTDAPELAGIKIFRFTYFDELKELIASRLRVKSYDIILHAAAVSDYQAPMRPGKIASDKDALVLRLKRAPKLIALMRRLNPRAFLVMFKLETCASDTVLIARSRKAMRESGADLAVANRFEHGAYKGFIVDHECVSSRCARRASMAARLFEILKQKRTL